MNVHDVLSFQIEGREGKSKRGKKRCRFYDVSQFENSSEAS